MTEKQLETLIFNLEVQRDITRKNSMHNEIYPVYIMLEILVRELKLIFKENK